MLVWVFVPQFSKHYFYIALGQIEPRALHESGEGSTNRFRPHHRIPLTNYSLLKPLFPGHMSRINEFYCFLSPPEFTKTNLSEAACSSETSGRPSAFSGFIISKLNRVVDGAISKFLGICLLPQVPNISSVHTLPTKRHFLPIRQSTNHPVNKYLQSTWEGFCTQWMHFLKVLMQV